jgi:hypothetical protein
MGAVKCESRNWVIHVDPTVPATGLLNHQFRKSGLTDGTTALRQLQTFNTGAFIRYVSER